MSGNTPPKSIRNGKPILNEYAKHLEKLIVWGSLELYTITLTAM